MCKTKRLLDFAIVTQFTCEWEMLCCIALYYFRNCKRSDDPLRKMSYVTHKRLAVTIEEREEHQVPVPSIPTFGTCRNSGVVATSGDIATSGVIYIASNGLVLGLNLTLKHQTPRLTSSSDWSLFMRGLSHPASCQNRGTR